MNMMFHSEIFFGIFLLTQMCIGVVANSLLFGVYVYFFLIQPHLKKPINSIFMHLTLVNVFTIIFTLISDAVFSFGVKHFLDDVGCQTVLFISRVSRGLSICTTSLLSTSQAIMISPMNSKWARFKFNLSAWIFPSFLCFWIINVLIYSSLFKTVKAKSNFTPVGHGYYHVYCRNAQFGNHNSGSFFSVTITRDLVFVAIMICTSLYMVNLLYRHHRRAQHALRPCLSSQTSPEHKATRTILLLVVCFVFFHFSNNIVTLYSFYLYVKIPSLERVSTVLSSCYSTICPFLLIKNNKIISKFLSSSLMRTTCSQ